MSTDNSAGNSNGMDDNDVDAALFYMNMSKSRFDSAEELREGVLTYVRNVYNLEAKGCRLASLNRRFGVQSKALGAPLKTHIMDLIRLKHLDARRVKSSLIIVPQPEHNEAMSLLKENLEVMQGAAHAVFENAE